MRQRWMQILHLVKKTAALALLFSFIVPPTAFAQSDTSTPVVVSESTIDTQTQPPPSTPVSSEETTPPAPAEATKAPPAESLAPVEPESPPMALMSVPGTGSEPPDLARKAIAQKFYSEPDPVTGSLLYTYPLTLPLGRNGMTPSLALTYSSQPDRDVNVMGYGWNVNIPYIQTLNKKGVSSMYAETYFTSSLDGELLPIATTSGTYGAKVENGSFNKYVYSTTTSSWTMTDKLGTTYKFGTSTAARQDNPSNSAQIYKWMLQEVRDPSGNFITYEYVKHKGQIYPYKAKYTGNGVTAGIFEVEFLTEARSDIATSTSAGFEVVSEKRINEIQAKINGSWVRKYALAYTVGDNGRRSVLNTVTESGKDESGVTTTLPAIDFDYRSSDNNWDQPEGISLPIAFSAGVRLADINGDGLTDIAASFMDTGSSTQATYLSNGAGWVASSTWTMPEYFWVDSIEQGVRVADVNGDGLADILRVYWSGTSTTTSTYINNGAGWMASSTWNAPIKLNDNSVQLADVNGDGLVDILRSDTGARVTYLNNGLGWTASSTWNAPIDFLTSGAGKDVRLEDLNGDGLVDMIQAYFDGSSCVGGAYINNGAGWTINGAWGSPLCFSLDYTPDAGIRFADVNGDGLPDLLQAHSHITSSAVAVYINTGKTWVQDPLWSPPDAFSTDSTTNELRITDVNGDGLPDLLQGSTVPGTTYLNNSRRTDIVSKILYPEGGVVTFGYKTAQEYKVGSDLANSHVPFPLDTLFSTQLDAGVGVVASTSYFYEAGRYSYTDVFNKQFAGFGTVTKIDDAGNRTKSLFHQGDTTNSTKGEYADSAAKIGKAYRTETYDSANNLYAKSITKWDSADLGQGRTFVNLAQQVDSAYDGDSDHADKATSYSYSTTTGNTTLAKSWGEVTGADDGTFSDIGSDIFSTATMYAASSTGYLVGLASQASTTNQSGTKINEQRLYYDSQSLGVATKGNLTKKEDWLTGSSYASSTWTYSATYGTVATSTDPMAKSTGYIYDSYNLYPATTTNPLSQKTATKFDYSSGKVATTTDPNGAVFATVYDGLDRVLVQKQTDIAAPTQQVSTVEFAYTDTALPSVHQTKYLDGSTAVESYVYFDGFGRVLQQRVEAEDGGDYMISDYAYNNRSLLAKESLPYFKNGSSKTSATANNNLYQSYTYDPLGRVMAIQNAVGTTNKAYDDWLVTTTDARGKVKDLDYDAYGRLATVTEHNSGSSYVTSYEYDGNGNLTKLTDALGNIRNFTYDGLSRQLTGQDLHAVADATFGTWTYTYDASGNRLSSLDPKSQTVNYTFDSLNRTSTENYTGTAGTEKTYTYDSCMGGIGRLCSVGTSAATSTYQYDKLGRIAGEYRRVNGTTYAASTTYDRLGNALTLTYPDLSIVTYTYNSAGLLETITQKENGTTTVSSIVTDFDYGPAGAVTYQKNGNTTETFNTYDEDALYRLVERKTIGPGTALPLSMMMGGGGDEMLVMEGFAGTLGTTSEQTVETSRTPNSTTYKVGENKKGGTIYRTQIYAAPTFDLSAVVSSDNSSKLVSLTAGPTPLTLSLADPKEDLSKKQAVVGKSAEGSTATYSNILGAGASVVLTSGDGYMRKDIVLDSLPSLGKSGYEVTFKLTGTSTLDIRVDGQLLSEAKTLESTNQAEILDHSRVVAYVWPPRAEDASGARREQSIPVSIRYELRTDGIYLTKIIPRVWLTEAQYPVRADFVLSVNPGIGDGMVSTQPYPGAWTTQRGDTTGISANYTGPDLTARTAVYIFDSYMGFDRGFVPFDTSSLPDNAVISSSTLYMYVKSTYDDYNDGYDYMNVYHGSQAAGTSVINADINDCGTLNSPTKGSTDVDITSMATSSYQAFTLNSSGRSWISTSTYTKLCFREGHDADNQTVAGIGSWKVSGVTFASFETAGTSKDPYLEVEYTVPNTAPSTPDHLLAEGQTNPTHILDLTPEFTARYNDPDTTDIATSYQIQVSADGSWGSPLWDSGKTTLPVSVAQGAQTLPIAYAGSALTPNAATYYWRIKFWDDEDGASPWSSGSDTFGMANDGSILQDFHYTYDAVGNITRVFDDREESGSRISDYTYDDLNRLTSYYSEATTPVLGTIDTYKVKLTVGSSSASSTLSNFPVYVDLSTMPVTFWNKVRPDGGDIRVKDSGGTEVPVEIIQLNTASSTGQLYFKATSIASGSATDYYLYYGDPNLTKPPVWDTYGSENVWNSTDKVVYHFEQLPNGTAPQILDSTTNDRDATSEGSMSLSALENGKIGKALHFDGSDDRLTYASSTAPVDQLAALTVSAWVKQDVPGVTSIITSYGQYSGGYDWAYLFDVTNTGGAEIAVFKSTTLNDGTVGSGVSSGAWNHVVGSWDGTGNFKVYTNGNLTSSYTNAAINSMTNSSHDTLYVGDYQNTFGHLYFDGLIDELRISAASTTNARVASEYVNQSSPLSFYSVGAETVAGTTTGMTLATTSAQSQTFTYNAIGNLLTMSDQGAFAYAGNTGSLYANPHAVTGISTSSATTTYAYDNNGNLTSGGSLVNTWDYLNRITQTLASSSATTTYGYDHTGQRVKKTVGGISTYYPNKFFDRANATTTKYIWVGDELVATVEGNGVATTTSYMHADHLGSTNAVTDSTGAVVQALDYYPFGAERIDAGTDVSQRQFIGEMYDEESSMSYLNARYLQNNRGQFISQDPMHLALGDPKKFSELIPMPMQEYLKNPQALNSYSYAGNNPIRFSDPKGLWYIEAAVSGDLLFMGGSTGLRFDGQGVEWFASGGPSFGVTGPVEASFSSGNLTHKPEVTTSRNGKFMAIAGMGASEQGTYDPQKPLSTSMNRQTSYSVNVGIGAAVSQEVGVSAPIVQYKSVQQRASNVQSQVANTYNNLVKQLNNLVKSFKAYVKSQKNKK